MKEWFDAMWSGVSNPTKTGGQEHCFGAKESRQDIFDQQNISEIDRRQKVPDPAATHMISRK